MRNEKKRGVNWFVCKDYFTINKLSHHHMYILCIAAEQLKCQYCCANRQDDLCAVINHNNMCCFSSFSQHQFTRLASLAKSAHLVPLISQVAALGHTYTENNLHAPNFTMVLCQAVFGLFKV